MNKIIIFIQKHELSIYLPYILLFLLSVFVFSYIQSTQGFTDPDAFYHAKMALIIKEHGIITNFQWLPFTILSESYADHHLLYHIILVPFVTIFDPLVGTKIATILQSAIFVTTFYLVLKKLKVFGAFYFSLFLIFIPAFIYRTNLGKANTFSFILLFLCIYAIIKRKYLLLFVLSFLFVYGYGGWILIYAIFLIYFFSLIPQKLTSHFGKFKTTNKISTRAIIFDFSKTIFTITAGTGIGLIFNPYFPQNISFYWQQIISIGIINYKSKIGVGAEWYSYPLSDLLTDTTPLFIFLFIALILFAIFLNKQTQKNWFSILCVFFFLIITHKSRRYVEYFVPFGVFFIALSFSQFINKKTISKHIENTKLLIFQKNIFIILPLLFFGISIPLIFANSVKDVRGHYENNFNYNLFSGASNWLKENTKSGSIVFHSDWDEFPILFYNNTHNFYISGLDPTFMYKKNPDLHQKYVDITLGEETENLYSILKNDFRTQYIFVDTTHQQFKANLDNNFFFEQVFEDNDGYIYKIIY